MFHFWCAGGGVTWTKIVCHFRNGIVFLSSPSKCLLSQTKQITQRLLLGLPVSDGGLRLFLLWVFSPDLDSWHVGMNVWENDRRPWSELTQGTRRPRWRFILPGCFQISWQPPRWESTVLVLTFPRLCPLLCLCSLCSLNPQTLSNSTPFIFFCCSPYPSCSLTLDSPWHISADN